MILLKNIVKLCLFFYQIIKNKQVLSLQKLLLFLLKLLSSHCIFQYSGVIPAKIELAAAPVINSPAATGAPCRCEPLARATIKVSLLLIFSSKPNVLFVFAYKFKLDTSVAVAPAWG